MLDQFLRAGRDLLIQSCCPLCREPVLEREPKIACLRCRRHLRLPASGLHGTAPLAWSALGPYAGTFRQQVLSLKRNPDRRRLGGLTHLLKDICALDSTARLIPVPSWRRRGANPLPELIASGLGHPIGPRLRRRCASIGQHSLKRHQRLVNLRGAFHAQPPQEGDNQKSTLWLVDDILTTGGTALAAQEALTRAGHQVKGLLCLARTPQSVRDLGFDGREGDAPG